MDAEKFKWDWGKHTGLSWLRDPIDRLFELLTKIQPLAGQGLGADDTSQGRMLHTTGGSGESTPVTIPGVDFNFKILDASDTDGIAQVLIQDGVIWAPNNSDSVSPDGMPSEDTYELEVDDGDEIWVGMSWTRGDTPTLDSAYIDHGPTTPDDSGDNTYITIGYVFVDYGTGGVPTVFPSNTYCGDIIIEIPPAQDSAADFLVLVQDTDDGTRHWIESTDCSV